MCANDDHFRNCQNKNYYEKKDDSIVQDFIMLTSLETLTIYNPCIIG